MTRWAVARVAASRRRPSPSERLLRLDRTAAPADLLTAANDPSMDVARRALRLLAGCAGAAEREALRDLVWTCDVGLAVDVARALRARGDPEILPTAVARLHAGPPAARCRAARVLAELGDERARPALCRALGDRNASVRAAAVQALARTGRDPEAAQRAGALVGDPAADVRRRAVRAVGRLTADPTAHVHPALADPEPSVRREVARLAARLPGGEVARLLADRDVDVRREAARNAGVGAEEALAGLLEIERHPSVRLAAVQRLGLLLSSDAASRALLDAMLDDPHALVRAAALTAARDRLSAAELALRLHDELASPAATRRAMALRVLAKLPARISLQEALRLAADPQVAVRQALAELLSRVVDEPAAVLAALLADSDHGVRHSAAAHEPAVRCRDTTC
jgi:HEAT repeat protein